MPAASLLRETEKRTGITSGLARCFEDLCNPDLIEDTVAELVAQRVFGLALGYEGLNDHDDLMRDPVFAVLVEENDPEGERWARAQDRGKAAAGKSTLNRLELTPVEPRGAELRYKKISTSTLPRINPGLLGKNDTPPSPGPDPRAEWTHTVNFAYLARAKRFTPSAWMMLITAPNRVLNPG